MDGLWTRTRAGRTELKVVRDDTGVALEDFAPWAAVIDRARQPTHPVGDGDGAIAARGD